jgi:hypothetical protein
MDTKNLVVGQRIWMRSGDQFREATVVEITEEYIAVKPVSFNQDERPWIIHFQTNGKQFTFHPKLRLQTNCSESLGNLGIYELYPGWGGWMRFDPHPLCGEKWIPWELVEGLGVQCTSRNPNLRDSHPQH